MKECPNCKKTYDDTWSVCLSCKAQLASTTISVETFIPKDLQALSSVEPLHCCDKFVEGLFLPSDKFYADWNPSVGRMMLVMADIFEFLKMSTMNVYGGYSEKIGYPGLYIQVEGKSIILIDSIYRNKPFEVAAILSHECMHHYLRINNLEMSVRIENELKTDMTTISEGFGIVYINGMSKHESILPTALGFFAGVLITPSIQQKGFGYYDCHSYGLKLMEFLSSRGIQDSQIIGYVRYESRPFLFLSEKKPRANKQWSKGDGFIFKNARAKETEQFSHNENLKDAKGNSFVLKEASAKKAERSLHVFIMIVGLIFFLFLSIGMPIMSEKNRIENNKLGGYAAEIAKTEKEIEASSQELDKLKEQAREYQKIGNLEKYNATVDRYNALLSEARAKYEKYTSMIKEYNDKIKK